MMQKEMQKEEIQKGDKVIILIIETATVTDISDAHGKCYQIELPQKDYQKPRRIWLNPDEVTIKKVDK